MATACATVPAPRAAHAAGAFEVTKGGTPLVWQSNPVLFNADLGTLGKLANGDAVTEVLNDFAAWSAVSTAMISFAAGPALPVDVTAANYDTYYAQCGDRLSPIIFDTDGGIMNNLFGPGSRDTIAVVARP